MPATRAWWPLHVTPAGRRLTQRITPIAERYESVALAGFSAAEAEILKAALRRLYANMDGPRAMSRRCGGPALRS